MYNQSKIIVLSLLLFSSAGCSTNQNVNKTLSPPADTKWVNFEVKIHLSIRNRFRLRSDTSRMNA